MARQTNTRPASEPDQPCQQKSAQRDYGSKLAVLALRVAIRRQALKFTASERELSRSLRLFSSTPLEPITVAV